ncbi:SDR family oxidoreductase [Okibacterium endophyticum]
MRLDNKTIIVTGGSSGIGRESALRMAAQGANLVIADLAEAPASGGVTDDEVSSTTQLINSQGGNAIFVTCDVSQRTDTDTAVAAAIEHFGRLDVMFSNAGIVRAGQLIEDHTDQDLDDVFNINVKGAYHAAQSSILAFKNQEKNASGIRGNFIATVSTAGLGAHPRQSPYNMSKAAQANLVRCLALEYGEVGIRANGICPTYAKTSASRVVFQDPELDRTIAESIPLKRWASSTDVANVAVFLASDEESGFITGDLIKVDGGETLSRYSV